MPSGFAISSVFPTIRVRPTQAASVSPNRFRCVREVAEGGQRFLELDTGEGWAFDKANFFETPKPLFICHGMGFTAPTLCFNKGTSNLKSVHIQISDNIQQSFEHVHVVSLQFHCQSILKVKCPPTTFHTLHPAGLWAGWSYPPLPAWTIPSHGQSCRRGRAGNCMDAWHPVVVVAWNHVIFVIYMFYLCLYAFIYIYTQKMCVYILSCFYI